MKNIKKINHRDRKTTITLESKSNKFKDVYLGWNSNDGYFVFISWIDNNHYIDFFDSDAKATKAYNHIAI